MQTWCVSFAYRTLDGQEVRNSKMFTDGQEACSFIKSLLFHSNIEPESLEIQVR